MCSIQPSLSLFSEMKKQHQVSSEVPGKTENSRWTCCGRHRPPSPAHPRAYAPAAAVEGDTAACSQEPGETLLLPGSLNYGTQSRTDVAHVCGLVCCHFLKALWAIFPWGSSSIEKVQNRKLVCVISQNGSKPFLHLGHRHVLPQSIILNLRKIKSRLDQNNTTFWTEVPTGFAQKH